MRNPAGRLALAIHAVVYAAVLALLLLFLTAGAHAGKASGQAEEGDSAGRGRFCGQMPYLHSQFFSRPLRIDNAWFPLVPGTQMVLEGTADQGNGPAPHRVVTTVTDLSKLIHGIRTLVVYETDHNAGQLIEAELAFYAQDDFGNVWNLGQFPKLFEGTGSLGAPDTWLSGVSDAEAGVLVPGRPLTGMARFSQGSVPSIGFLDCGEVAFTGQSACIRASGCFTDVLVVDENSPLDAGAAIQRKHYAPGFGVIKVEAINDPEVETLELVQVSRLSPAALADIRAEARRLEATAYILSLEYGQSSPMEQLAAQ
jgi:hypothetical protein